jgi:plasmid stability protein
MTLTLELKDLPNELAERIKSRAALHGRTPEQEALVLLQTALAPREVITPKQLLAEARAAGIKTSLNSVRMVRQDRDAARLRRGEMVEIR